MCSTCLDVRPDSRLPIALLFLPLRGRWRPQGDGGGQGLKMFDGPLLVRFP